MGALFALLVQLLLHGYFGTSKENDFSYLSINKVWQVLEISFESRLIPDHLW